MFAQVRCPDILLPEELDNYLERGWFRMGQNIFTTNFLNFNGFFYNAIWLRIPLNGLPINGSQQKIIKRNSAFRTEIRKAFINPEKEALFDIYKESVPFNTAATLQNLLFGKAFRAIYNTHEVNVYDGNKLIATGFFDLGSMSAAGITCFYDPSYKKYSLGKYLIYLKLDYCRQMNFKYFYPGYFVPGYSLFDYKLEIGKATLQYFEISKQQWYSINDFSPKHNALQVMQAHLIAIQMRLSDAGIASTIFKYEFFDVNTLPDLMDIDFFDFPVFLYLDLPGNGISPTIVFDVRDHHYHLIQCSSLWSSNMPNVNEIYSSDLFRIEHFIFSSKNEIDMVANVCSHFSIVNLKS